MDEKFNRRFVSFTKSLDALAEARERDLSDSFVLSGTSAKFSITFDLAWKDNERHIDSILCNYWICIRISERST